MAELAGPPDGEADVAVELVARAEPVQLADGSSLDGYTIGGSSSARSSGSARGIWSRSPW